MGILGEKLFKAGIVSQKDVDRVHRQETIHKERIRQARERRKAKERAQEGERALQESAKLAASLVVKTAALLAMGFSDDDCKSLVTGSPKPSVELLFRLGSVSEAFLTLLKSEQLKKLNAESCERFVKNPEFRKLVQKFTQGRNDVVSNQTHQRKTV